MIYGRNVWPLEGFTGCKSHLGNQEGFAVSSTTSKCEKERSKCISEGGEDCEIKSVECFDKANCAKDTATEANCLKAKKCEREKTICLQKAGSNTSKRDACNATFDKCYKDSGYTVAPAGQATRSRQESSINYCQGTFNNCKDTAEKCKESLDLCLKIAGSTIKDSADLSDYQALLNSRKSDLSPELKTLLKESKKQIKGAKAPTASELDLAQGGGVTPSPSPSSNPREKASSNNPREETPAPSRKNRIEETSASYTPHQDRIRPHDEVKEITLSLTPQAATDRGTEAQEILENTIITPTIRQQIRNDVRQAVDDAVGELKNQYEIQYVYQ